MQTIFHLTPDQFTSHETQLANRDELSASVFRYPGEVCALRLRNSVGELVLLPWQGQQIWDATMRGRRLTMKSMFDAPCPTREFLSTYGAFLLHCGATAMGSPGPEDNHPLHGELPNAPYQHAALVLGADERGEYIGLTGEYRHTVAFNFDYTATPLVKFYAGSSIFGVSMRLHNRKASPMPLMVLEHVNFRPARGGRLAQSVKCNPQDMRVRSNIPSFMEAAPGYLEFVKRLQEDPSRHLVFEPGQVYDPEVVFYLAYLAGRDGWARTLQIHPDGSADLMRHRPDQLDQGVRWICLTADQEALGMEPGTAGVEGFSAEKKKGHVRSLPGGSTFALDLEIGVLTPEEARREQACIDAILSGKDS